MAARATTVPAWERAMNRMKLINDKAWEYMNKSQAPAIWSRSHFKMDTQLDLQVNNMCVTFNRAILEYRDKCNNPIFRYFIFNYFMCVFIYACM